MQSAGKAGVRGKQNRPMFQGSLRQRSKTGPLRTEAGPIDQSDRLLKPTSTLREGSDRKVVSTSWIFPPWLRNASMSACNCARIRARPATEWLSSLSLLQLPDCSRLLSSNSLTALISINENKTPSAPNPARAGRSVSATPGLPDHLGVFIICFFEQRYFRSTTFL